MEWMILTFRNNSILLWPLTVTNYDSAAAIQDQNEAHIAISFVRRHCQESRLWKTILFLKLKRLTFGLLSHWDTEKRVMKPIFSNKKFSMHRCEHLTLRTRQVSLIDNGTKIEDKYQEAPTSWFRRRLLCYFWTYLPSWLRECSKITEVEYQVIVDAMGHKNLVEEIEEPVKRSLSLFVWLPNKRLTDHKNAIYIVINQL